MEDFLQYLDPKILNKISNLELKARLIVEGYISGLHKSPYRGFAVEFAQHREYVPGDDLRYVDWKVYGKSDRYYIKQYEEETNLISYFLLDASASMLYASGDMSKFDYACHIVASLAYLTLQQQDAVGLYTFDREVRHDLPPSSNPSYLKDIIFRLSKVSPQEKTNMGSVLSELCGRLRKRGLVIILSDFFDDVAPILAGLRRFRHRKHDVIVFHILDHDETEMPLQRLTMFEGLEDIELKIIADPRALRQAYLQEVNGFLREIRSGCMAHRIDYVQLTTNQLLDVALSTYLATRAKHART
jgi:uncharacterized protein (DUF58 family)